MPTFSIILIAGLSFSLIFQLLYIKKTRALEDRNKRLEALKKLDEIMMSSSTNLEEVAQKVTDAIAFMLGFEIGVLALVDEKRKVLRRVAMSHTTTGVRAETSLPFPYKELSIPLNFEANIAIKALRLGQKQLTHNLFEVFTPVLDERISAEIQKTVNVQTSLIYPVKARGRTIGVMIISSSKHQEKLSRYEIESIEELVNVVGIALDNALLYKDLKITSDQLKLANERLRQFDKLKDDFVSIASHELRTPMTAIRSYVWMALHKSDVPISKKVEGYLVRVLISTQRLINLVNDMLNVSRIESGRIEINPEPIDLIVLAKDIIDEVYYSKSTEKTVKFELHSQKIPKVLADVEKLREVFLNLVGNSLKFTPDGGKIIFDFFSDGLMVETSVTDTGVGISRDDLGNLFQKFGRLNSSYTAAATSGGTGLGLYISKKLVELMHGKIWVSSEGIGKGAKFSVSLPVASEDRLKHIEEYRIRAVGEAKGLEPVAI